jgi:hypothetical protein
MIRACKQMICLAVLFCFATHFANAQVVITLTATPGTCPGNGSITVNATGVSGTPLYAIKRSTASSYSPEQTSNVFNNYGSGEYTVKVHDANGSTISSPVTLTNASYTVMSIVNTKTGNAGATACEPDGSIEMDIAGGRPPFTYHLGGGPTARPDSVSTSRNMKYAKLATGIYSIDVTDACANIIVKSGIVVTSLYNLNGVVLDSLDGMGGGIQYGGNCADTLLFSTNNIILKDTGGVIIFERYTKTIPAGYPLEARVEYPAGSNIFTSWQTVFGKFPLPNFLPTSNQYRVQVRNPCDPSNIVTSPAYTITYPYVSRSGFCSPSITRATNGYTCGPIDILIVNKANTAITRSYTWDGSGLSYSLDLTGLALGAYSVQITTAGVTYQAADVSTTLEAGMNLAATYNYISTENCDFFTGGIRSYRTGFPADNAIPITYSIVAGPVSRPPVTSLQQVNPIWNDLPAGAYQVKVDYGDCRTETKSVPVDPPFAGFAADELTYRTGSSCGKFVISGKGWYLAPDSSISPSTTQVYAAKLFNEAGIAITGTGVATTAINNNPFSLVYEVGPGTYRVKMVNQLHSQLVCYYLEKTITIPPYEPVQIDIARSGGVACGTGFGTVHVGTTGGTVHIEPGGGSSRTLVYRIKPFGTTDDNFTPYQLSPDFPNRPVGVYTAQVFDSCNYTTTQNIELVERATFSSINVTGAVSGGNTDSADACQGNAVLLRVDVIGTATDINWTLPNGTTDTTGLHSIANFAATDAGKYFVAYTSGGCSRIDSVTLFYEAQPTFTLTDTSKICIGDSVDLLTTISNISSNSVPGIFINPQATVPLVNTTVAPLSSVNYFIRSTDTTTGCVSVVGSTRVVVNGPPLIGPVVPPPPICAGQTLALTFPSITEQGTPVTDQGWILNGSRFDHTAVLGASDNGIEISYFAQSACGITITPAITVAVNDKPEFSFNDPPAVYSPATVDLNSLTVAAGDTTGLAIAYYDSVYNLLSDAEAAAADSGTYHIIGTTAQGCSDTSTVTVTVLSVPLPVGMLYFKGAQASNNAILTWGTSFEQNSSRFDIYQSTDGINFTRIGTVHAAGNSSRDLHYTFIDQHIARYGTAVIYYRLKQVDEDNQFEYSSIVRLKLNAAAGRDIKVYPVPFSSTLTIDISALVGDLRDQAKYELVDMSGRILYSRITSISNGQTSIVLTGLSPLPNGLYNLRIVNQYRTISVKVVKGE